MFEVWYLEQSYLLCSTYKSFAFDGPKIIFDGLLTNFRRLLYSLGNKMFLCLYFEH